MQRVYLDQAATSWPKSPEVLEAVSKYLRDDGAAAGRGSYSSALVSMNWVDRARVALANLIHASSASDIALMNSGTHALNEAILGVLRPGSHVITTAIEHNSVLRPLERLRREGIIELDIAPCDRWGWVDPAEVMRLRRGNTKLVAMGHASNVTGRLQDITAVGQWCQTQNIVFLVDAAQTIGYVPIDVNASGIDYLAAPGHKGLGGILGTGFLYLSKTQQAQHRPLLCGGTGSQSESLMPDLAWPQVVEPGNLNVPGIVSLAVAGESLMQESISEKMLRMQADWGRLKDMLAQLPNLSLLAEDQPQQYVSVMSCTHAAFAPTEMAALLDAEFQVEARAGLHCAGLIHPYLGTAPNGTVRFSFGHSLESQVVSVMENVVSALAQC